MTEANPVPLPPGQKMIPGLELGEIDRIPRGVVELLPGTLLLSKAPAFELPGGDHEQTPRLQAARQGPQQAEPLFAAGHVVQNAEQHDQREAVPRPVADRLLQKVGLVIANRLVGGADPVGVGLGQGEQLAARVDSEVAVAHTPVGEEGRKPPIAAPHVQHVEGPPSRVGLGQIEHSAPARPGPLARRAECLGMGAVEVAVDPIQRANGLRVQGLVPFKACDTVADPHREEPVPQASPRRSLPVFDPAPHERELVAIVEEIAGAPNLDSRGLDRILKRHPRRGRGLFSRSEIIAGFRHFAPQNDWHVDADGFVEALRLRPVRTQSGVTPVTVLTKPYPCPGRCIFCPDDVRMPKSYLSAEPGAQRAENNGFDPYRQTWSRLATYHSIGHPVDKVELIVLGGTWSFYPPAYQIGFVKRCFDALNDFGEGVDRGGSEGGIDCAWSELESAQRQNETSACRCVGLSVETRPDHLTESEVLRIRRLGGTKVQIGIQSLSDRVLSQNRRGHDVAATRRAFRRLRGAGFKIHAHWMPNLYGSSPVEDMAQFAQLFEDPDFRPDELKIYPCSLIESAELMKVYQRGDWRPYTRDELLEVLETCLERVPRYCRLTRVIRDFSSADIVAGNRTANLREVAEARLRERGVTSREIRSREIRGRSVRRDDLRPMATEYETSIGVEVFLEFVTPDDRIAAFLRLSLPRVPSFVGEVRNRALVREVHVYGSSLALGGRRAGRAQHSGLGRALLEQAQARAQEAGFDGLAVISAVGTREYYRRFGFRDGALYQHLTLVRQTPAPGYGLRNSRASPEALTSTRTVEPSAKSPSRMRRARGS